MKTPGQAAFEAYNKKRGGTAYDGSPIPGWDKVKPEIRAAWEVAALGGMIALFDAAGPAQGYNLKQLVRGEFTLNHVTELVRRAQVGAGLEPDGMFGPATRGEVVGAGWSPLATRSPNPWSGRPRPEKWRGAVYGLVLHTTGTGIHKRAAKSSLDPLDFVTQYYERTTGTHYVIGWNGELIQVASEGERAYGVGEAEQRLAEGRGDWERLIVKDGKLVEVPEGKRAAAHAARVERWRKRWAHLPYVQKPLDLVPEGARVNGAFVHAEMIPLPRGHRDRAAGPGLYFTLAQHETAARLAVDVAVRNGFADQSEWWRNGRLVGHEDLTFVTRPGWDPGTHWGDPGEGQRFSWDLLIETIEP